MKLKFKVSGPIKNPDEIGNLRQPAKLWLASMISALGNQMSSGGGTAIVIQIDDCEFEFSAIKIPGYLETFKIKGTRSRRGK